MKSENPSQYKYARLQLAGHAVNNTAGPDGITPTLLVLGAVPRIPLPDSNSLPLHQKERIESMRTARKKWKQ